MKARRRRTAGDGQSHPRRHECFDSSSLTPIFRASMTNPPHFPNFPVKSGARRTANDVPESLGTEALQGPVLGADKTHRPAVSPAPVETPSTPPLFSRSGTLVRTDGIHGPGLSESRPEKGDREGKTGLRGGGPRRRRFRVFTQEALPCYPQLDNLSGVTYWLIGLLARSSPDSQWDDEKRARPPHSRRPPRPRCGAKRERHFPSSIAVGTRQGSQASSTKVETRAIRTHPLVHVTVTP
jgi:hypothetical protein